MYRTDTGTLWQLAFIAGRCSQLELEGLKFILNLLLLLAILIISCSKDETQIAEPKREVIFLNNSKIVFAAQEESQILMGSSDEYSKILSPFDIESKTQNTNAKDGSDYLQYAALQAREWINSEIDRMIPVINATQSKINALGLNLKLPEETFLVKSTMEEEGGAMGYTRSNYIVMKSGLSVDIFLHKLFHIYSRANPDKRDELYASINFKKCNTI